MTIDEFQKKYHEYSVDTYDEALLEAIMLDVFDDFGNRETILPMEFNGKYCLMVKTAVDALKEMGL